MNEPIVSVRNLTKSFGGRKVVDKLSFDVGKGEVFPAGMRAVSEWMPLGVGIKVLKSVSVGCYDNIMMPLMVLAVITVICGSVAVKTFRWE